MFSGFRRGAAALVFLRADSRGKSAAVT